MASVDLVTGSTFAGRYRIVGRLASGGMGAVYEVVHLETRRRRALKVMLPELFTKPDLRDRFRREAHVTASVKSEFLVDVFDAGLDEPSGMPFLVMELLEGQDLGRLVERSGPLSASEVVTLLAQVASALDRTHAASIVHRDLKPENLFLTHREDGSPCIKILDFGISKMMNDVATGGRNTTSIGTPAYMAPEQITGGPVSPAADLHSLGLIAYTLLTGRAYWQDDVESTDNALAFALRAAQGIREGAVSRARRHGHTLPTEFDAWFSRAANVEPKQRFTSASETVQTLAEALGEPLSAPALPPSARRAASARPAASTPRADEHGPSTMHGTELGASHRKPGKLVRWFAAGSAIGLVAIAVAAFATRGTDVPTPASPAVAADRALVTEATPAAPTPTETRTPIVSPVEPAVTTSAPAPSTAAAPARTVVPPAASKTKTPKAADAAPASATSSMPAKPDATAPAASATATVPSASASSPKIRYTRD
jgi:serine/threonine-protein kinase